MGMPLIVSSSSFDSLLTLGGYLATPTEFWLWLTLVLFIAEVFTAGFFLGALGLCTILTAGGAWLGLSSNWQAAFFAVSSIGSLLWVRPVFVNLLSPDEVRTNTDALAGQAGTVIEQIPAGGIGRVRLANEEWRATSGETLQVGDAVRVHSVAGSTVTVAADGAGPAR